MKNKSVRFQYRKQRVRDKIRDINSGLPRLSVRRSLRYFYAQVIDDTRGVTLAAASSFSPEAAKKGKSCKNLTHAKAVGLEVAKKALAAGVKEVVFDRGGRVYRGRSGENVKRCTGASPRCARVAHPPLPSQSFPILASARSRLSR